MKPIKIAIIGFGKIAADQHVPSIAGQSALRTDRELEPFGQGRWPDLHRLARADQQRRGPRGGRDHHAARAALRHCPRMHRSRACTACSKSRRRRASPRSHDLACLAEAQQVTLFTTWHAQHHSTVDAAAKALAGKRIASMEILWHEDVHKWHPGQHWIWEPGGFGVFDPGINAFSIATKIFPGGLFVKSADLSVPAERADADRGRCRLHQPAGRRAVDRKPRLAAERRRRMDHHRRDRRRQRSAPRRRRVAAAHRRPVRRTTTGPANIPTSIANSSS